MNAQQFLVVTLHSGEPDYEHCVAALKSQINVHVKHVKISGYPEHEAHKMLYGWFNDAEPGFIRVKLDADVVLCDPNILQIMGHIMRDNPNIDRIDPYVHDFLTDTDLKAGLAIYSPRVRFHEPKSTLWCDRNVTTQRDIGTLDTQGAIALHMKHCDERTAFRYGFHRGLKSQTHVYDLVKTAHAHHNDPIRRMAIKGFELAVTPEFDAWHRDAIMPVDRFNYDDDWFKDAFAKAMSER